MDTELGVMHSKAALARFHISVLGIALGIKVDFCVRHVELEAVLSLLNNSDVFV
jgi:hypothetical protein